MTLQDVPMCKGSWLLGSACGKCQRCLDEAPQVIAGLRENNQKLMSQMMLVSVYVPRRAATMEDLEESAKATLFDLLRSAIYREER